MKEVTCFVTSDGMIHLHTYGAKAHAKKRYESEMYAFLQKLDNGRVGPKERLILMEFIENNFSKIAELAALKEDLDLQENNLD